MMENDGLFHSNYPHNEECCMQKKLFWILVVAFSFSFNSQAASASKTDQRQVVMRAMVQELQRSMKKLKMPDFDPPYFINYEMKDNQSTHMRFKYGAVYKSSTDRSRRLRVEIRVGSYQFDNVGSKKDGFGFSSSSSFRASSSGPIDNHPGALRNSLWLMTDAAYKTALKAFLKRKSKQVTEVKEDTEIDSFSTEQPAVFTGRSRSLKLNKKRWRRLLREASTLFQEHTNIFDSNISMNTRKETRYFTNSEGTRIITENLLYSISLDAATRAPDGMLLKAQKTMYAQDESRLPSKSELFQNIQLIINNLENLRKAPILEPYTGPAILDGDATGVLFHEVVGHRLEGERQLDDQEGKTFKGQINKLIVPEFLSVIDDPTKKAIDDTALNGFYRYDDEGVSAKRVVLIENGILKSFLTSRTPVDGFPNSNGHGRSSSGRNPRARMANTIVDSKRKVPLDELKKMLVHEVKKQDKPYGLILKNIIGGSTQTSTWGYQAYKGIPELVYRVFPDGREELVRGVELVGTPIASINKIIATSDTISIFNGYCGAESGYIPVSAAAPDVLMTEIELQRTRKEAEKSPILQSPWNIKVK